MPTRQPLSEADVLATAQREGLDLIEAPGTATGYKGVTKQATTGSCYMARAGGKHLGSFPSACHPRSQNITKLCPRYVPGGFPNPNKNR